MEPPWGIHLDLGISWILVDVSIDWTLWIEEMDGELIWLVVAGT